MVQRFADLKDSLRKCIKQQHTHLTIIHFQAHLGLEYLFIEFGDK